MSKESKVIKYYNQFRDFAEPLLDLCLLDDDKCNVLFWYGFHSKDHAVLLCRLVLPASVSSAMEYLRTGLGIPPSRQLPLPCYKDCRDSTCYDAAEALKH
jgi:hypothetical protein